MGRSRPPKQSAQSKALQKIQIASARQKLKLDTARAQKAIADAPSETGRVNQFGRPIVKYEDMPELDEGDLVLLKAQFHRLACPHVAVLQYRPGFEDRGYSEAHARDCWWFYNKGVQVLKALALAILDDKIQVEQFDRDDDKPETINISQALSEMSLFLKLEREAEIQAAVEAALTAEEFRAKNKAELTEIETGLRARFTSMREMREDMEEEDMEEEDMEP